MQMYKAAHSFYYTIFLGLIHPRPSLHPYPTFSVFYALRLLNLKVFNSLRIRRSDEAKYAAAPSAMRTVS